MGQAGEVVYVVDDDDRVRAALTGLLESAGLTVVSFRSASGFLTHIRCDSAACLILDLQLPGISGLDLQQRLAESRSPPIIFISGHANIPATMRAMRAGAVEFLTKPVDPQVLLRTIAGAFVQDRRARAQEAKLRSVGAGEGGQLEC